MVLLSGEISAGCCRVPMMKILNSAPDDTLKIITFALSLFFVHQFKIFWHFFWSDIRFYKKPAYNQPNTNSRQF